MSKNITVKYSIEESFIENIKKILNLKDSIDVTKNSLAALNWIAEAVKNGEVILSAKPGDDRFNILTSPFCIEIPRNLDVKWVKKE